jgi:hypothetical protein
MASVAGIFLGLTFRDFLGKVAEGIELCGDRLHRGQCCLRVPFQGDELASDFGGTHTGIKTCRAKLRISLTLTVDEGFDIGEQVRQVVFRALAPTGCEGIKTPKPACYFMHAFAECPTVPAEFAFCTPLAAWSQFFDRPCHEDPASAALQGPGRINEQCLERISQLHTGTSST